MNNLATKASRVWKLSTKQKYIATLILTFINLINYVDRLTVAGTLEDVKGFFDVGNAQGGLIQTSFVVCYTITAPFFGYFGDRYSRKWLIVGGVTFWSIMTLLGSFVPGHLFGLFLFLRALVGVGEASYSTIAPTMIGDLFSKDMRSKMLAVFYLAIPFGSGLGYIVGNQASYLTGKWQWSQRITPMFGALSVLLTIFFVEDPPRGEADGITHLEPTNFLADLKHLYATKSYVFSTLGFTCVSFSTGAIAWFGADYMRLASQKSAASSGEASLIFGVVACLSGIFGVIIGCLASQHFRKYYSKADPLICAYGVLISVPVIYVTLITADVNLGISWAMMFVAELCMSVNWPILADMLLYTIVPTRRSLGEAVQIMTAHALGDAVSPYIVGQVSDSIYYAPAGPDLFLSLQYAMFIPTSLLILGAVCFFMASLHIAKDRATCNSFTNDAD